MKWATPNRPNHNKEMMNQPVGPVPLPVHTPPRLSCYGGWSKNNNFIKIRTMNGELWCVEAQRKTKRHLMVQSACRHSITESAASLQQNQQNIETMLSNKETDKVMNRSGPPLLCVCWTPPCTILLHPLKTSPPCLNQHFICVSVNVWIRRIYTIVGWFLFSEEQSTE